MKTNLAIKRIALLLLPMVLCLRAGAQGTTFSYQGSLSENNQPANGLYEFRFILYNAEIGGSQAGNILTNAPVAVTNGLFTTTLDFGTGVFDGRALWVELAVRPSGSANPFDPLAPRQPVLPTPYAITASNLSGTLPAAQLSGLLPAAQLSGTVPDARLSASVSLLGQTIESAEITDGTITAADLDAASFGTTFWRTTGNLGTDPTVNFLGTINFQSLDLRVGNIRALRLQPHVSGSANLIGGYSGNAVAPGRGGATIAGGGTPGQANQVQYDFGTVSGGKGNDAGGEADTIGGGDRNRIGLGGFDNTIGGGFLNDIGSNTTASTVGGGWDNNIGTSLYATIAGGFQNTISNNSPSTAIGGGRDNKIAANAPHATIAGGYLNDIGLNADSGTIGGGQNNNIGADALYATIAGGWFNDILATAHWSVIGGGRDNNIGSGSFYATIAGGADNNISSNALWSALGGGWGNTISGQVGTIAGGYQNEATNSYATVPGGYQNRAGGAYSFAAGRQARANHTGAFVWADSAAADFPSAANNEFAVRAAGGARFGTLGAGMMVDGQPVLTATSTNEVSLSNPDNDVAGSFTGAFTGNGAGLTNLNAWRLNGNAATTPGANFLGTTDNQPLELKVNNIRALRLEPTAGVPNFIAGDAANAIGAGVQAATIGGGSGNTIAGSSSYATIAGGYDNDIGVNSPYGAIGGGENNNILSGSFYSTIAGGAYNNVASDSEYAIIAGGGFNNIGVNAEQGTIGGGIYNTIADNTESATIAGGERNEIGAGSTWSAIGGGHDNNIASNSPNATIAGGRDNLIGIDSVSPTIAGGERNLVGAGASFSTIGGGLDNNIFNLTTNATIAGGFANDIAPRSHFSSIGGGKNNNILSDSDHATIAGGWDNTIAARSGRGTISGGFLNTIASDAAGATIAGGAQNDIAGGAYSSVIGGGGNNGIGQTSPSATIAGGSLNNIGVNSDGSAIGGGVNNSIRDNALYAVIPGGWDNRVGDGASAAFAAGRRAKANHDGSFVWADFSNFDFSSTVANGFFVRSVGGVKFVTGIDGSGNEDAGLRLVAGSSAWDNLSDRNSKENVAPVDTRALLERLVRIPIQTWNWKAQEDSIRHIGPMAQDFHAAFNVGQDDKHISTVDADGVALAAIQGLNQKVEEQRAELKQKQTEIAELRQRLDKLEQLLKDQLNGGAR